MDPARATESRLQLGDASSGGCDRRRTASGSPMQAFFDRPFTGLQELAKTILSRRSLA